MPEKQIKTVKYIDFSPKYIHAMVELGNKRFGHMYTNENTLYAYVKNKNNICKLVVDVTSDRLLGSFLMHGTDIVGLSKEFNLAQEEIRKFVGGKEKICVAKSLVLQKDVEKLGLATKLVKKGLEQAKYMGFYSCWSPLWIRKDGSIPAKKVIERNGFEFYKNVQMLWIDDKDYKCIDCDGPCKCDAAIYNKIL